MSEVERQTGAVVIPTIRYFDAPTAIDWLCAAFGFEKRLVVPGNHGGSSYSWRDPEGQPWHFGDYNPRDKKEQ